MENASKALLMGVSILIGVLLLSFMAYIILFMSDYSQTVQENLYAKEIYEFNTQFQIYDGRTDLTAQNVKSIVNLVCNYNSKFDEGYDSVHAIKMSVLNKTTINEIQTKTDQILENSLLTDYYKCDIRYSNGKIIKIIIKNT